MGPGRPRPRSLWEFQLDDGLVLVRPELHGLFVLNSTAGYLWNELRRGLSAGEAVVSLTAHFGISPEVARRDVDATMASWRLGLLAPPPPPVLVPSDVTEGAELCPIDCEVNGRSMRVLLERGDVWQEIAPRLEPVRTEGVPVDHTYTVRIVGNNIAVFRDALCIGNEENAAGARAILLQAMVSPVEPVAILHAGGCGGILLAGQTHSGKSTLCAALMSRGLSYHCDDSAVLDHEFRVAPMPFPLALRPGSWPLLDSRFPALRETPVYSRWGTNVRFLTPVPADGPATVTALVFVRHDSEARTRITELNQLESLLELQRSGFWVEHTRESIGRFLGWLQRIRRFELVYAQLEQAEEIIVRLAGDSAALR